jgi:integrase
MALRRCEVLRLTRKDAADALVTGRLRLTAKRKTRSIPLQRDFRKVLEDYVHLLKPGYPDDRILPISRTTSETILREFSRKHSIDPPLTFHQLRRSLLRAMWENGERPETLSQIAGHEDTRQTLEYIGVNESHMREAFERFSLLGDGTGPKDPPEVNSCVRS